MKFKAVYSVHSRFVVNKSEKNIDEIALKKVSPKVQICFLFLHDNTCFGYSLEVPHGRTSNEYPQHMFSWPMRHL